MMYISKLIMLNINLMSAFNKSVAYLFKTSQSQMKISVFLLCGNKGDCKCIVGIDI